MKLLILTKYVDCIERNIYCIQLTKKLTIGTTGLYKNEKRWCWTTLVKRPSCTGWHQRMINKLPCIKRYLVWNFTLLKLNLKKEQYKICQGCGEGIAKYRIRNPNYKHGNERYNCCDGCVDFYDWRWSAMNIIGWKNKKPICKKGTSCMEVKRGRKNE